MGGVLFHDRVGLGGRTLNGLFLPFFVCLASCFSLRARHFLREEKKERAEPSAALIAARRNIAGISGARSVRGMIGLGFDSVVCVSFSRAVRAPLFLRAKKTFVCLDTVEIKG